MSVNSDHTTERIIPDDGRRESGLVLLTAVLILLLGGAALAVNQTVPAALPGHLLLETGDKATLTALRNAGDEILFMREAGEPLPDIVSLVEIGIPPFAEQPGVPATHRWYKVSETCYIGSPLTDNGQEFLLILEQDVSVYWRSHIESAPIPTR